MTDSGKIIVDGRELAHRHPMTLFMVQNDALASGERRWQPDLMPPDPFGWNWLGQATTGEHLYWLPMPAERAADPSRIPEDR